MRMWHIVGIVAVAVVLASPSSQVSAQTVVTAVKQDTSPPLSSVPPPPPKAQAAFRKEHRVKRLPPLPTKAAALADTALQTKVLAKLPIGPLDTIEGIGEGLPGFQVTSFPADTTGAAGTTQYVQWVNTSLLVLDKATKKAVLGPSDGNILWRGFGGNCENFNDGDPIVLFDRLANRWVFSQFAVSGTPFSQCIAVSTTADATGPYHRYEFQYQDFNDYGKFGIWPDAYYATYNMFAANDAFLGAKACGFERAKMQNGEMARMVCFDVSSQGGLLPADLDGTTPPPAGAPNYVMNFGSDRLNLWKFKVDWSTPSASALTGPTVIRTAPFTEACQSAPIPGTCIAQPGTTVRLDSLSDRLMYRLAYRNFGTHESLVVNHSVAVASRAGVRWYEVRDPGGTPKIQQQGTYAPTTTSRWMGSIAMDKRGNIAIGYSVSGTNPKVFPSIRLAGRSTGDPLNQLSTEQSVTDATGKGSQKGFTRWGDYSTLTLDPTDDCSFWYTAQYQKDGANDWHTKVIRFKFNSCQ
jgi:hypothetical protein